jgi:hypothetical protein
MIIICHNWHIQYFSINKREIQGEVLLYLILHMQDGTAKHNICIKTPLGARSLTTHMGTDIIDLLR